MDWCFWHFSHVGKRVTNADVGRNSPYTKGVKANSSFRISVSICTLSKKFKIILHSEFENIKFKTYNSKIKFLF